MKKALFITGVSCVIIVITIGIYFSLSPETLDFRGTITDIEVTEQGTIFRVSDMALGTSYTVVANNKTKVEYCHTDDGEIDVEDIAIGDVIEGNYRWRSKDHIAKFITVEYHNP